MTRDEHPSSEFERLSRELAELRERLTAIDQRLARLESPQASLSAATAQPPPAESSTPDLVISDDQVEIIEATAVEDSPPVPAPKFPSAARPPTVESDWSRPPTEPASSPLQQQLSRAQEVFHEQWEDIVGGRWMTWAGALTLIVAVGFFVPWAWTELELPNWSKVLILHALGLGVSLGALVMHMRGMKVFAQGLAGVGVFTLYASAWAAQHHYSIWGNAGDVITFAECAAITALAVATAVWWRSPAIVLLGALGGYLTPFISGGDNHVAIFSYLAFLNVALVASAVLRSWSFLKPIGLAATMFTFASWLALPGFNFDAESHTWSTQWLATLHWTIFLLGATLPPVVWRRSSNWLDLAALTTGALWFVGLTWVLFHERVDQQLALVCWGMSLLHLILFGVTYNRVTNIDRMPRVHLALAAIFFILAMPLQLESSLSYLALAWAAQGVVLSAVGIYFRDRQMCVSSLVVFALAALRLLAFDYPSSPEMLGSVDRRFLMFTMSSLLMIVGGALYPLAARLLRKGQEDASFWEPAGGALLAVGNLLAMIGLTCQWDSRLILLLWTIDAALIWAAGFALRKYEAGGAAIRTYGLLLGVLLVGGRALYHGDAIGGEQFAIIVNERFGTLLLMAVMYFAAAWMYRKNRSIEEDANNRSDIELALESNLDPIITVLANVVLVAALSLEIRSWFYVEQFASRQPFTDMQMAEQAAYSILWAIYAAVAVVLGLVLRWPALRYVGLVGLALVLAKVFFIDLASLRLLARVLALAVLGMMLLAVSFVYQRFQAKLKASQ